MSTAERRERDHAARHRRIITTARELAEADGWDAVTTRRLAERIEYSQPVLYGHFAGKGAIVGAVALEGFAELAAAVAAACATAEDPRAVFEAFAQTYVDYATEHPAVYDAMFVQATDLPFAAVDTPPELRAVFTAMRDGVVAPLAGDRDPDTLTELVWSALHGLVSLARGGRLRPEYAQARLALLIGQFTAPHG